MQGDGSTIPREISVENGGFSFKMQLWVESPARTVVGAGESSSTFTQKFFENCLMVKGVHTDKLQMTRTSHSSHGNPCYLPERSGVKKWTKDVGPILLDPNPIVGQGPNVPNIILKG